MSDDNLIYGNPRLHDSDDRRQIDLMCCIKISFLGRTRTGLIQEVVTTYNIIVLRVLFFFTSTTNKLLFAVDVLRCSVR